MSICQFSAQPLDAPPFGAKCAAETELANAIKRHKREEHIWARKGLGRVPEIGRVHDDRERKD